MNASHEIVDAHDAAQFIEQHPDMLVLDVRTQEEWERGHIPQAIRIDIQDLPRRWQELPGDRAAGIICVCAVGARSAAACDFLAAQGYTNLYNVMGGMMGYTGETATGP
jgi:rhodanese-related sulfurtransferase